jgi:ribosomal-protein-alanine N-acetyltransferase
VPSDLDAILGLETASFVHPEETFNRRQVRGLLENPRAVVLVAQMRGELLAWAAGLLRRRGHRRTGRLYALAVHPGAQGQGLGRLLAERMLEALRATGAGRVYLEVRHDNAGAIALYRKLGFRDARRLPHYYGHGRHGLSMVLDGPAL